MRILVINGPNINLLGIREPTLYGEKSYAELLDFIHHAAAEAQVEVECLQTNHEGAIIDAIHSAMGSFDGIVINPTAYTHTSIAILDALQAVGLPVVEVHLTDVRTREDFRQVSFVSRACEISFAGKGFDGYAEAIRYLANLQEKQ